MIHRLLPLGILLVIISYIFFNFQDLHQELVYKLGISGDKTTSCCNPAIVAKSNGDFDENASQAIFDNQVVNYPKTSLAYAIQNDQENNQSTAVLGASTDDSKWIEVSLSKQLLTAWEGTKKIMEFSISSGKWAPTPTGTFRIWYKIRSINMVGGDKSLGTYYNLPNVPDDLFFFQGFALHGAYWHNNFGQPMSHGCVNEPLANAAQIFDWAGPILPPGQNAVQSNDSNPGTRVVIHN